ncbi:hypothetical protein LguiA_025565 [Lonicera macranthoides]
MANATFQQLPQLDIDCTLVQKAVNEDVWQQSPPEPNLSIPEAIFPLPTVPPPSSTNNAVLISSLLPYQHSSPTCLVPHSVDERSLFNNEFSVNIDKELVSILKHQQHNVSTLLPPISLIPLSVEKSSVVSSKDPSFSQSTGGASAQFPIDRSVSMVGVDSLVVLVLNHLPTLPNTQNSDPNSTILTKSPFSAPNDELETSTALTSCPNNLVSCISKNLPRSYASVLIPTKQLSHPVTPVTPITQRNGDLVTIKLDESMYQKALSKCKNNLLGRLILHRGVSPMKAIEFQESLNSIWKIKNHLNLTPIGRNFYVLHFEEEADLVRIRQYGQTKLKIGMIKLSNWTPDFVPSKQK